ncbi:PAS domain S-box protein [Flammeovirga sp. EKP202]|uniref:PAS domain-containing sensor histidine kinase n=1 Tax=Flammeovirga sp. EKP202 TaxID=2770592 RepID=UPI00165FED59|nr:PAS domain S-box protein [Flammeovirga sp. EKP202]MBD0400049.1 PAS domain S-box protein [Flammeovirga sp. EKP202]
MSSKILEQNNFLSPLFYAASEGIIICNKKGEIVAMNPMGCTIFGYEEGELIGRDLETLLPDAIKKMHKGLRNAYFEKPEVRPMGLGKEFIAQKKSKEVFYVEVSISHMMIEDEFHVAAFVNDITKRKNVELQVVKQQQLLEYYADYAPAAIAMLDKDLTYLIASNRWKKTLGVTVNLEGKTIQETLPNFQQRWYEVFDKVLKGDKSGVQMDYIDRIDLSNIWIEWEAHPWYNSENQINGIIIFAEDVTERVENEQKVKQYMQELILKNRELEDFAYVSSHDLQEPLRKIRAFGDRLSKKEKENLSPKGQDYINRMLNSAERMQQLITDLLRFSRISSKAKPFEEINLNDVLRDVISDLEIAINESEAVIRTVELPTIKGDITQLRQLFQNLISNAIKFRNEDTVPQIRIDSSFDETKPNEIEISISDNGIGFDDKYSERIFQIFQRLEGRKYNGSGIGLAICKKITQRHGGDITASSQIGKGTTFTFTLRTDLEEE